MADKELVPGVGAKTPRAKKQGAPKAAAIPPGSDLQPRVQPPMIPAPAPAVNHADVLSQEVTHQVTVQQAAGGTMNRELIQAVLQEMGMLPPEATVDPVPRVTTTTPAIAAPYGSGSAAPAATLPPLVSQGLVNVLSQLQQMAPGSVDKKLDDLTSILALRKSADTMEARQRYTLLACVQMVQDFESLWVTPAAPQMY